MMPVDPQHLGPVVYKADQCITEMELMGILGGFTKQFTELSWWHPFDKIKYYLAMSTLMSVVTWYNHGRKDGKGKL